MIKILMTWAPSPSAGVERQDVKVVDSDTSEVYEEISVGAEVSSQTATVPEGCTVKGIVSTVRGEEAVVAVSEDTPVGWNPLQPATDVQISVPDVTIQPVKF